MSARWGRRIAGGAAGVGIAWVLLSLVRLNPYGGFYYARVFFSVLMVVDAVVRLFAGAPPDEAIATVPTVHPLSVHLSTLVMAMPALLAGGLIGDRLKAKRER